MSKENQVSSETEVFQFRVDAIPVAQPRQRHRVAKTAKGKQFVQNYTPQSDPVNTFKAAAQASAIEALAAQSTCAWFFTCRDQRPTTRLLEGLKTVLQNSEQASRTSTTCRNRCSMPSKTSPGRTTHRSSRPMSRSVIAMRKTRSALSCRCERFWTTNHHPSTLAALAAGGFYFLWT